MTITKIDWRWIKDMDSPQQKWNNTNMAFPQGQMIHQMFEHRVVMHPHVEALVFQDTRLTFEELNKRANQLAWYLRKRGVGPNKLVAMCMQRSWEMIVGALGILKAGG